MNKKVSIILPTYNGAHRISDAVNSIRNQTYHEWELLVVDDGSHDNTRSIIEDFSKRDSRIYYIKNEQNLGIQKSLNRGLQESKGEYIARIDDDDEWCDSQKLEEQVKFLNNNPDYVLVGTGVIVVDENKKELFRYLLPETDKKIRRNILSKNCFVHSSVLFNKEATMSFGGYSEHKEVLHVEDYDLWLKLGTVGKMANLQEYSVKFTLREGSISGKNKIDQFKKNLNLIFIYKNKYHNFIFALGRSLVRIIVYGFLVKSPVRSKINKFFKFYKENL